MLVDVAHSICNINMILWYIIKIKAFHFACNFVYDFEGICRGSWYFEVKIDELPDVTATRIGWSQQLGITILSYLYSTGISISLHLVLNLLRYFGISKIRVL